MAAIIMTMSMEMELVSDAIDALLLAHSRLSKHHGDAFRALDRRIEALLEEDDLGRLDMLPLGADGRFVVTPPEKLQALVDEARRLGVI